MRYLWLLSVLLLTACSTKPPSFTLVPEVYLTPSNQLQQSHFSLQVQDLRTSPHTLYVTKGKQQNVSLSSNDLTMQLQQTLSKAFTEQGAQLSSNSQTQLNIQINQLDAKVMQRPLDHQVNNQINLTLQIWRDGNSFSKSYAGESSFTGPLNADIAAVERELRILTEQVLIQLLQDPSWQDYVRNY